MLVRLCVNAAKRTSEAITEVKYSGKTPETDSVTRQFKGSLTFKCSFCLNKRPIRTQEPQTVLCSFLLFLCSIQIKPEP